MTGLVTEVSQLNARARAGEERNLFPFYFLFGHIINNLLTELGRSVWENLASIAGTDLTAFGLYWRPWSRFSHTDLPLGQ